MSKNIEITVPSIGGAESVLVAELLVAKGDIVVVEQSLVVLESDKASMEVPSPLAGTVSELRVAAGDEVNEGGLLMVLNTDAADSVAPSAPATPEYSLDSATP